MKAATSFRHGGAGLRVFLTAALATMAAGAREGDHKSGPRVTLYQHADYRGDSLTLYPGEALDNLSGRTFEGGAAINDRISSIRIEDGAEVRVYEHSRYGGQALHVTESVRDLTGRLLSGSVTDSWNDRISSLRIAGRGPGRISRGNADAIIRKGYRDLLVRDPDESGLRLYRGKFLEQGWTESMMRDHIRRSEEYRKDGVDRIVHRAYRDVLGRDADESGLRTHRRNLLERNWSESDVRDALRNSEEYRNKQRKG